MTTSARSLVVIIFFLLTFLIVIPLLLILLSPFLIWRAIVALLAKIFKRKQFGSMLSGWDSYFLLTEPDLRKPTSPRINIIVRLKGRLERKAIEDFFLSLLSERKGDASLKFERLHQHVTKWLGFAFFEWDKEFILDTHLRVLENLDRGVNEGNLTEFLSSLTGSPFLPNHSWWEAVVIQNFGSEAGTLLVIFFHHVMFDGYSFLGLINSTAGGKVPLLVRPKTHISTRRNLTLLWNSTIEFPYRYCQDVREGWNNAGLPGFPTPNNVLSPEGILFHSTSTIPIGPIKEAKARLKVPFVGILIAAISMALRNQFVKDGAGKESVNLAALLPYQKTARSGDSLENSFGCVEIQLNLRTDSMAEQLGYVNDVIQKKAESYHPTPKLYSTSVFGLFPLSLFKKCQGSLPMNKSYVVITNMPGPESHFSFCGLEVEDITFCNNPTHVDPIIFGILSYKECIRITVAAHPSVTAGNSALPCNLCQQIEVELDRACKIQKA